MKKQLLLMFILTIVATMWTDTAQAQTKYKIIIADVRVTSDNCDDLSVIDGVSGTVKYDNATKTLTLQDAQINARYHAIYSGIEDLTIKVIGSNELSSNSRESKTIYTECPLTITGGGILNAESSEFHAIYVKKASLTIDNCIVNAKGEMGIRADKGELETLTIRNATVTAQGKYGSISGFGELELKGCYISKPSGAKFDPWLHAVALNGEIVKEKVVIKKDPTAIDTLTADAATKQGIYTFEGMRLKGSFGNLPKGVYIVNGRKVVKK